METLNLIEILKGCPAGTPLFSPIFGDVELSKVWEDNRTYPIEVMATPIGSTAQQIKCFAGDGKYLGCYANDDVLLFPSKDCRDWTDFVPPMP